MSTRSACCDSLEQHVNRLQYWRYDRERSWVRSTLAELLATDNPEVVTTVFVHGNRVPCDEAFTKGWRAYRTLVACAPDRPVRFIIWSWPSDSVGGPVQDVRIKAARTNPGAYHLAWLLDQLDPDLPVSLWAHSYGARIVSGALHLLGGGELGGSRLSDRIHPTRQPMQAVLLIAALDNDWLLPGHFHGSAISQTAGLLLVNNGCDSLLNRYHRLYGRRCCQQALGYTGMSAWGMPVDDWSKIAQVDACCYVGRSHLLNAYLGSPNLMASMRPYLLFEVASSIAHPQPETVAQHEAAVDGAAE